MALLNYHQKYLKRANKQVTKVLNVDISTKYTVVYTYDDLELTATTDEITSSQRRRMRLRVTSVPGTTGR
jgi:hypothetical protein